MIIYSHLSRALSKIDVFARNCRYLMRYCFFVCGLYDFITIVPVVLGLANICFLGKEALSPALTSVTWQ